MSVPTRNAAVSFLILSFIFFAAFNSVGAESKPYYVYNLGGSGQDFASTFFPYGSHNSLGVPSTGGQLGAVTGKGDFNGDAIDDLAIATPFHSTFDRKNRGMVQIFFGKKNFSAYLNDPKNSEPNVTFLGVSNDGHLGTSFAAGDLNHDGIDDMIMGAPGENSVFIMYGSSTRYMAPSTFDLGGTTVDWVIRGRHDDSQFGFALDSTDVNGDSIDDIVIGSPFSSKETTRRAGKVYVIYGHGRLARGIVMYMSYSAPDLVFSGNKEDDRFGITLAHGDFDKDKTTDLVVGSYMATNDTSKQTGTVTIFFGSKLKSGFPVNVNLGSVNSDNTLIAADRSFDWFGYALVAGDLNNDGADDLAISSFPYLKNSYQGEVDVLWGKKGSNFEHAVLSRVYAPHEPSLLGGSLLIADVNHDGASDLLIGAPTGAPGDDTKMGRVYALTFFPRNNEAWNFSKIPADMTIVGRNSKDWFGSSVITGDFDNDGHSDLVIGAPGLGSGSVEYLSGPLFPRGQVSYTLPVPSDFVRRGSFMSQVMRKFRYDQKNKEFIASCMAQVEFCFFQFSSQTKFGGLTLEPNLQLYPDVKRSDFYYDAVNMATILGYVRGFLEEKDSPFHPEKAISRIHALKILMTSTGILPWKDYYELKEELSGVKDGGKDVKGKDRQQDSIAAQKTPYQDVSAHVSHMWWYPRYLNYAYLTGIIDDAVFFQPDAPLVQKDLDAWIERIQEYVERRQQ